MKKLICILMMVVLAACAEAAPPYHGTIFVDPDIITSEDPTSFKSLAGSGRGKRTMFDRRGNRWVTLNAHLFTAVFDDTKETIEVQVNPEFDPNTAFREASTYLRVIGQLPLSLRKGVKTVWIHKGNNDFGGGNDNLLIHTARGEAYISKGILAETFVHEATHTSLDALHSANKKWIAAQKKDQGFISKYAKKNPQCEDLAESFLLYLALRYRTDRIDKRTEELIKKTIPNRISYFDGAELEMHPVKSAEPNNPPDENRHEPPGRE